MTDIDQTTRLPWDEGRDVIVHTDQLDRARQVAAEHGGACLRAARVLVSECPHLFLEYDPPLSTVASNGGTGAAVILMMLANGEICR